MNFELIDNLFQIIVLGVSAVIAGVLGIKRKSRGCIMLGLAYICFSMGTLYWLLHIAIKGQVPQIFCVSEISWSASYFCYLSFVLLRVEGMKLGFSSVPALCTAVAMFYGFDYHIMGPSYFFTIIFVIVAGTTVYLTVYKMRKVKCGGADVCLTAAVFLQILLYISSAYMEDFTRFNLYFAIDFSLTIMFAAILPMSLREEAAK